MEIPQQVLYGQGLDFTSSRQAVKKTKVKRLPYSTNALKKLTPYQFEYKKKAGIVQFGFLAEEVETIFPNLVHESQGIKSLNYQGLIPVLVNAVIDQQNEIERLKKRIYR